MKTIRITVKVNGRVYEKDVRTGQLLLHFLRDDIGIKTVKEGCDDGFCGACTVLVNGVPVKSCMMLAAQVDGSEVTTLEGLEKDEVANELKESFREEHALQCGYCTSGFIIASTALLKNHHEYSLEGLKNYEIIDNGEIKYNLEGNMCRCTGYEPIIKAVHKASERLVSKKVEVR